MTTVLDDPADWCRTACLALPGATTDVPFGPGTDVFRVHGRIFALLGRAPTVPDHPTVTLKAEPDEIPLLLGAHPTVVPGYHMNKKHWVTVALPPDLDTGLVGDLVEDSYDLVVLGLPARLRPLTHRR
ncbi:MmcQ/YjbR family DNA-binding protein [Sanguibacter suaedae]|uniref:MmcQ/YjbR family DNA-binding protein n=1 Tax=Sanguibacter suaedae TaxID=2795737 RepID=A0A934IC43_9MICO|nr:MmcQ/YjbR family DNA-binding protein [Sanguibacter suaedae]MBI9115131.1 MmcQ/YjbR family DNA-binding protein [Sanguibacter suaedae]